MRYGSVRSAAASLGMGGDDVSVVGASDLKPGRYEIGITIRNVTGDATDDPPAIVPFLWNWEKGPFGSGKLNLERELSRQGIAARAVAAKGGTWSNPHRSGKFDLLGLSPMLWDVSFTVTLDILGPTAPGMNGMGIAPVVYVAGALLIIGLTNAIVKSLGGGDVVIDFVRRIGEGAAGAAAAIAKPVLQAGLDVAAQPFKSASGLIVVGLLVGAGLLWATKSPKGRAAKKAVWG